jgi:hypothetical protein
VLLADADHDRHRGRRPPLDEAPRQRRLRRSATLASIKPPEIPAEPAPGVAYVDLGSLAESDVPAELQRLASAKGDRVRRARAADRPRRSRCCRT